MEIMTLICAVCNSSYIHDITQYKVLLMYKEKAVDELTSYNTEYSYYINWHFWIKCKSYAGIHT